MDTCTCAIPPEFVIFIMFASFATAGLFLSALYMLMPKGQRDTHDTPRST